MLITFGAPILAIKTHRNISYKIIGILGDHIVYNRPEMSLKLKKKINSLKNIHAVIVFRRNNKINSI